MPFEKLTGHRHVPILAVGNGVPFLQFKKPQSPYLSRIIRDKVNQRQKRLNAVEQIEENILFAREEEDWENMVAKTMREGGILPKERAQRDDEGEKGSWARDLYKERSVVLGHLRNESDRATEMGEKLLEIADKERELWKAERRERKLKKSEAKKLRREQKDVYSDA